MDNIGFGGAVVSYGTIGFRGPSRSAVLFSRYIQLLHMSDYSPYSVWCQDSNLSTSAGTLDSALIKCVTKITDGP